MYESQRQGDSFIRHRHQGVAPGCGRHSAALLHEHVLKVRSANDTYVEPVLLLPVPEWRDEPRAIPS
jgi:hypothetical protein